MCVCVCFCLHISLLIYTSAESICFRCTGLTAGMERQRLRELCALLSKFLLEPNSVSSTFWATLATHWSHSYSSFQHLQRYFSGEFCHCKGLKKKTHEHTQVHCFSSFHSFHWVSCSHWDQRGSECHLMSESREICVVCLSSAAYSIRIYMNCLHLCLNSHTTKLKMTLLMFYCTIRTPWEQSRPIKINTYCGLM